MGNSISNFIELLTQGDFFLIFLIVMMVVIIGVIVYLVRLQINDAPEFSKKEEDDENYEYEFKVKNDVKEEPIKDESFKITSSLLDIEPEKEYEEIQEDISDSVFKFNDDKENLVADEFDDYSDPIDEDLVLESPKRHVEQSRFVFEDEDAVKTIKSYEDEQEQNAIISARELETRLNEMRLNGELESHEKELEQYEREQETKAIISYEELLERAKGGEVSYESEENIGGIKVGKVDTSHIESIKESNDKPYYREEAFLEAMKEFRRAL